MRWLAIAPSLAPIVFAATVVATPALAAPGKSHSLSPRLKDAVDLGRAPAAERHRVVVSLDVRDRDGLEAFLADVQDPASPRYLQFLSQAEFDALYAPTEAQEQAVVDHLRGAGLRVTERFPNRLLVGAAGGVAALERAFGVEIHSVERGGKRHYAALDEPSLPDEMASYVVGVMGLDDLSERHPHVRWVEPAAAPRAALGPGCCHLSPNDVFAFYDNTAAASGAGQTIVIAGAYAWRDTDTTAFNNQWGLPQLPTGSGQVCTGPPGSSGCTFSSQNSIEIALDVEYAHGTAPAARILNYMAASPSDGSFTTMYNRIVTDNPGHVVSTSWGACEVGLSAASQRTNDNIFANANAIGQSWFAASGDSGSRDCSNLLGVDHPANSPHVMGVGGTTPVCSGGLTLSSPACAGYGSESAWSGSGGGVSQVFARPTFQTGCGVPAGTRRLVPDVALEANTSPGNYVAENGLWWIVGGTSDAAPQWAGLAAELAQQSGRALGNPGALLYGLCGTAAFHDVTSGSNGDYSAGVGYDLVTGLGSFDARLLLNPGAPTSTTTTSPSTTTTTRTSTGGTSTTTTTFPASCSTPTVIPAQGGTFSGTTSGTSTLAGSCGSSGTSPERVFQWTPAVSGTATIQTCGAGTTFDTVLYLRSGSCAGGLEVAAGCNDDACFNAIGLFRASRLTPTVTAGQTYYIVVDGYGGAQGTFSLTVTPPVASTTTTTPTNSSTTTTTPTGACASATPIPAAGGTFSGTTSGTSTLEGSCGSSGASPERVFRWIPTVSGTATIQTCGAGTTFDTVLYLRSGSCAGGPEVAAGCNDDACANATGLARASRLTPTVTAGQTYYIVVDGYNGAQGTFSLTVTPPAP